MKVFLISGKARSGKGEIARIIKKFYKKNCIELMFAKTIKQYAIDYFDWDGSDETKPRDFLQKVGTEIIRDKLNIPDFHACRVLEDIEILRSFFDVFVISDCRFPNELKLLKDKYGNDCFSIRVSRDFTNLDEYQQNHKSETALDNVSNWNLLIDNNGTKDDLEEKVVSFLKTLDRINVSEMEGV